MKHLAVLGIGTMGAYTARALSPCLGRLTVYDTDPSRLASLDGIQKEWRDKPEDAVLGADVVLVAAPTNAVPSLLERTLPYCKDGALISGQTSRKEPEAAAFDRYMSANGHRDLSMVSIHTLCNPKLADPREEPLGIIRHKASDRVYEAARSFYASLSPKQKEFASVGEHDTHMAHVQLNIARTNLSIASSFAKVGCFPWLNETYSNSLDSIKFALAMRAASFESHVYRGILFGGEEGKAVVTPSLAAERQLFNMIVSNRRQEYRKALETTRDLMMTGNKNPLLGDEDMAQFSSPGITRDNSHFSLVQWAVSQTLLGRDFYQDLAFSTPMHRSFVCMADLLFKTDLLDKAIVAPFENPEVRGDDLVFHEQINGWSEAALFENAPLYDERHRRMRENIPTDKMADEVARSKQVVDLCRRKTNHGKDLRMDPSTLSAAQASLTDLLS